MKGKGKWAVLLLALGLAFTGCIGGGTTGGSSEEGAFIANDNPMLGMFQVTLDPENSSIVIEPVTLGANSLIPLYSWTNQILVTDLVNRSSATATPTLTLLAYTNLANGHLIPGSERVTNGGVLCTRGTEYTIKYVGSPVSTGVGALARTGTAGACNIASGETVTITYGYGNTSNVTWVSPNFTTDVAVENHLSKTIEKLRIVTGQVSGPGAAGGPNIGATYADYPLIQPQVGSTYGLAPTTMQALGGWTSGVCYTSWGHWDSTSSPKTEGCTQIVHPKGGVQYAPGWMDPLCGRIRNSVQYTYTGAPGITKFYMELDGFAYDWSPTVTGTQDSRFDRTNYSTWYAIMGYLVPDGAGMINTWCAATSGGTYRYWFQGTMNPVKYGDTRHCGTLITDPHLPTRTYFSVNFGLEYPDRFENQAKAFWDAYKLSPTPDVKLGVGTPYMQTGSIAMVFDQTALTGFTAGTLRTGHSGSTYFPAGFSQLYGTGYNSNDSAGFDKIAAGSFRAQTSFTYNITAPTGYIIAAQYMGATYAVTNFAFLTTSQPTAPYVTQVANAVPGPNMPQWAGQWGMAHYNSAGTLVTEGADADLDFWVGFVVMKVKNTAIPGDYGFIRFDQTGSNFMNWYYNNQDANNHPSHLGGATEDLSSTYCVNTSGTIVACPGAHNSTLAVYRGVEMPNPNLPPGNALAYSSFPAGSCAQGGATAANTCGGHQYVNAVVCVQ